MATRLTRVLVVDDYEPWRSFLCSMLQNQAKLQVIGEAANGPDAVQKAQDLQPDLILMDIGLPSLNGIEATRQIRKLSPQSKILLVSENSLWDVAKAGLRAGASGYVVKFNAASGLLPAVAAVLQGKQFVSASLAGQHFTGSTDSQIGDQLDPSNVSEIRRRHEVLFYMDDALFLDGLAQFVGAALKAGNAAIVAATELHRKNLLPRLQVNGFDIGAAIEQGRYIALDAAHTLSAFMLKDKIDSARCLQLFGELIGTATKAAKAKPARVAIFGECVHLLWTQDKPQAAIQMEKLGNQLVKTHDVDILCAYSLGSFQRGIDGHIFQQICTEHSAVYS